VLGGTTVCRSGSHSPRSQTDRPKAFARGNLETAPLPHSALPVQPYYAALGLAARGCDRQPRGTEVTAIAARSCQRERTARGAGAKKAFGFPIRSR